MFTKNKQDLKIVNCICLSLTLLFLGTQAQGSLENIDPEEKKRIYKKINKESKIYRKTKTSLKIMDDIRNEMIPSLPKNYYESNQESLEEIEKQAKQLETKSFRNKRNPLCRSKNYLAWHRFKKNS